MEFVLADVLVKFILFIIMLGVGSTINLREFKEVFLIPRELITGLLLQLIALPLLAFTIAEFSGLPDPLKAGIVILAACPGGTTSNFISYLVNAKTSLSIALTSVNSILILLTIPMIAHLTTAYYLASEATVAVPFADTLFTIFVIILLPALLGMLTRELHKKTADKLNKPIKYTSIFLIIILFIVKFFAESSLGGSGITPNIVLQILPYVLLLHLGSLTLGFLTGLFSKFKNDVSITLGIEVGLQNTTLAILITSTVIDSEVLTYPALIYALFSFWTTLLFAWGMRRILKSTDKPFGKRLDQ
ncbi:MAG: bile acid:sodium symporter family protein [Candidatus Woesearchaeota archaeon]